MKIFLKKYIKPIVAPILITFIQIYLYLFYVRFKNEDIFKVKNYLKIFGIKLNFVNQSHFTFGIKRVINKKYRRIIKWNTEIEHGITIGGDRVNYSYYAKNVITMSEARAIRLSKNHPAVAVGPYIAYAESIYSSKKISLLKQELGRVLLVLPSHSTSTEEVYFDKSVLIEKIEEVKHDYESIIICLYWVDFMRDDGELYIKHGYKVVCAGHRFDPFFLSRLKTIILLADHCMTNNIGTHVGYCIYLNRPISYVEQLVSYAGLEADWNNKVKLNTCEGTFEDYISERLFIEKKFKEVFDFRPVINVDKMALIEYYWGLSKASRGVS